jgi:hypothetical protein
MEYYFISCGQNIGDIYSDIFNIDSSEFSSYILKGTIEYSNNIIYFTITNIVKKINKSRIKIGDILKCIIEINDGKNNIYNVSVEKYDYTNDDFDINYLITSNKYLEILLNYKYKDLDNILHKYIKENNKENDELIVVEDQQLKECDFLLKLLNKYKQIIVKKQYQ